MEIYMNELTTESPYELGKDLKFIGEIDHGAFGKVVHVYENKKKLDLAVKVINKIGIGSQLIQKMKEEISILKKLNHDNIVKFYGYSETNNQLLIKMEFIKYGTLSRWMKDHHKIKEDDASVIIGKVLSAVEYLHSMQICHRDIKPENIMISKENDLSSIKIIDFGLSAQHFNYLSNNDYCGTFIYMAPEQIEKKLYYYSVDIWSIGILMYMLLNNGKHPFYHKDDKKEDIIQKIKLAKLHFINKISYMAKHLMHKLCEPNPSWRYSANLAIKHPWITRNPNDDIPLTFNEVLNRNNNKKNAHTLIMISIFLNYMKKKFPNNNNNNENNNIMDSPVKKRKLKNKIFIISKEYIFKCNLISKKEKEYLQKRNQHYLEVISTEEEDSFEKKNKNSNNKIISLKKANKSTDKYISPQKKLFKDEDYEYSNRFIYYNNKKSFNKKKIINLNNNSIKIRNDKNLNIKEKNSSNNINLKSLGNKSNDRAFNENSSKDLRMIKQNNYFKNILNNNFINNRYLNTNDKNAINPSQTKCKSISKFNINKDIQSDKINEKNENVREQKFKQITPVKSKRLSIYKSSKSNKYQVNSNLPYVPTLGTQIKDTIKKKNSNNCIGKYNIIPLVLPFIGLKQDEKKNKMI